MKGGIFLEFVGIHHLRLLFEWLFKKDDVSKATTTTSAIHHVWQWWRGGVHHGGTVIRENDVVTGHQSRASQLRFTNASER
jgi:hypothetical protein